MVSTRLVLELVTLPPRNRGGGVTGIWIWLNVPMLNRVSPDGVSRFGIAGDKSEIVINGYDNSDDGDPARNLAGQLAALQRAPLVRSALPGRDLRIRRDLGL